MKKIFFFVITILVFTACSDGVSEESLILNDETCAHLISIDSALKLAASFSSDDISTLRASGVKHNKEIKNSFVIQNIDLRPALHIVNYKDGGFVIISADDRLHPIQAYSENGTFSNNMSDIPYGVWLWMEDVKSILYYFNENNESQDNVTKYEWDRLLSEEMVSTKSVNPPTGDCEEETTEILLVNPLVTTNWHQNENFNALLPTIICNGASKLARTGCVTIAIAQIAKFYQYPTSYQWSNMPTNWASIATQSFIKDLFDMLADDNSGLNPQCDGTGVNHSYNKANFFKAKLGYSSATQSSYNYQTVVSNLENGMPVLVAGDGHAWICDGCHEWESCYDGQRTGYLQIHMNMGWGEDYNAWYSYSYANIGSTRYTPDQMVYGIHP